MKTTGEKIKVGQRWVEKKNPNNVIEIAKIRSEFVLTKRAFGGGICHHLNKAFLYKMFNPIN